MASPENGNYQLELIAWQISIVVLKFAVLKAKLCVNGKRIFLFLKRKERLPLSTKSHRVISL